MTQQRERHERHERVVLEPKLTSTPALHKRLAQLERLVGAIEDELSDDELGDEQKLQNIGERVAQAMDTPVPLFSVLSGDQPDDGAKSAATAPAGS